MKRELIGLAALWCVALAWNVSCEDDDDDAQGAADDDDDNDDNDASPADDDDDNDDNDDTGPYTCETVSSDLEGICQLTLLDDGIGPRLTLLEWCELSEALFTGKLESPFWTCMGDCVYVAFCEQACFDACLSPDDPGGDGCDHTVHGIYSCGIVFLYETNDNYWIPEMDLAALCSGNLSGLPWTCYAQCVTTLACSNPPTGDEVDAMLDCITSCG